MASEISNPSMHLFQNEQISEDIRMHGFLEKKIKSNNIWRQNCWVLRQNSLYPGSLQPYKESEKIYLSRPNFKVKPGNFDNEFQIEIAEQTHFFRTKSKEQN